MIPFKKALAIIILSIIIVSGTASTLFIYFRQIADGRAQDPNFRIVAIAQKSSASESLSTTYLAELLGLSVDRVHNLYRFDTQTAKKQLLASPLIREAEITKIKPGTLYIDYNLRQPVAYSGDLTNTAISDDGVLIPFNPFFRPKKMVEITTGGNFTWGQTLDSDEGRLAQDILAQLQDFQPHLLKIDTSHAFDPSYGQRQIIVVLEEPIGKQRILRLSTESYELGLQEYQRLRAAAQFRQEGSLIVDLRIPHLGFVSVK